MSLQGEFGIQSLMVPAMNERCGDEVHCTCVPSLWCEVEKLKAENKDLLQECKDRADCERSLTEWNEELSSKLKTAREALEWYALADGRKVTIDNTVAKQALKEDEHNNFRKQTQEPECERIKGVTGWRCKSEKPDKKECKHQWRCDTKGATCGRCGVRKEKKDELVERLRKIMFNWGGGPMSTGWYPSSIGLEELADEARKWAVEKHKCWEQEVEEYGIDVSFTDWLKE